MSLGTKEIGQVHSMRPSPRRSSRIEASTTGVRGDWVEERIVASARKFWKVAIRPPGNIASVASVTLRRSCVRTKSFRSARVGAPES